jgi:hypothetical protein
MGFVLFQGLTGNNWQIYWFNWGQIGLDYPQIKEIDINPLLTSDQGLMAVDALIVL